MEPVWQRSSKISGRTISGKKLLPTLDQLLNRQIGFHFQSNLGVVRMTATEYSGENQKPKTGPLPFPCWNNFPAMRLVVRLSFPEDSFRSSAIRSMDHVLKFMSKGKIDKDSKLPGFDSSAAELLSFPSGDFALAGGTFRSRIVPTDSRQATTKLEPSFLLGIGVSNPITFKRFMAGLTRQNHLILFWRYKAFTGSKTKTRFGYRLSTS